MISTLKILKRITFYTLLLFSVVTFAQTAVNLGSSSSNFKNWNVTEPNTEFFGSTSVSYTVNNNIYFDSDGDGILDHLDFDKDNDGIADILEEMDCGNSNIATTTTHKLLNETFGSGNRTQINSTYNATTTYCYEDGNGSCNNDNNLGEGSYTVYHSATNGNGINETPTEDIASWADTYWYTGGDHTDEDPNGRMALFHTDADPDLFYATTITGALPNTPFTYSFWTLNLETTTTPDIATRLRPNIEVEFRDLDDNLLASMTTGDIPPSINGNPEASWYNFSARLTFSVSTFKVYFYNNQSEGTGSALALDDIEIKQILCDTDNDGVANIFDLDSDNDGIPDAIEAGFASLTNGNGYINALVDNNNNGMHDAVEGTSPLDSDNDGTPNYLDLDSDNDAIFDVDESGAGNSEDPKYENGDGDIDGDGVGDGEDTDAVRKKNINTDGSIQYFADGILDVYDFYNGNTMDSGYGNHNQGIAHAHFVVDTDTDGLPDYIDSYNNALNTFDISNTLYAVLDSNNDGTIDGTNDTDGDGLLDNFDTDSSAFGSPRSLEGKFQLYFDGRNDYIQDESLLNGWSEVSLMGWVKIDPLGHGHRYLFGQENFHLKIIQENHVAVVLNGVSLTNDTDLPVNQWVHIGATYNDSANRLALFINGEVVSNKTITGILDNDDKPFYIGKNHESDANVKLYFKGNIDEVRLFNKALSTEEYQKIVYQEIENNGSIRGTEIPRDIESLSWSNLIKYYRFDNFRGQFTDNISTDEIDTNTGAKLYNFKQFEIQSAPMPFITQQSGDLADALAAPEKGIYGDDAISYDWSIVRVKHNNITFNTKQKHLGLFIDEKDTNNNPIKFNVTDDSELNVSWYLKLDGYIDLQGQSQLVQGDDSIIDANSLGGIERDQQGTASTYTYNYWSSPVKRQNSTSDNFRITDIMKDGTDSSHPAAINFSSSGYNGAPTSPIKIADYWVWKYANLPSNNYSAWQHIRRTGRIFPGEGFTMKGPGTGSISTPQNYVFTGMPNNGNITLSLAAENDYLVGNPYPSAIDANQFIKDNGPELNSDNTVNSNSSPLISGTLYFWEHYGGETHMLQDYQGGYATYNYSGGIPAAYKASNHLDMATGSSPTQKPGRYIAIGQGFFVLGENAGNINFNNGQRVFKKEGHASTFMRSAFSGNVTENTAENTNEDNTENDLEQDLRMKFRIGYTSVNTIHRQLLLTIDENATPAVDWAYDGLLNEIQLDDMYWIINDENYVIQASNEADNTTIYPLGIKTDTDGINTIGIDALENVPSNVNVYLHDILLDVHHNLNESNYDIFLNAGEYLDRFTITFNITEDALGIDDLNLNNVDVLYANALDKIVLVNPNGIDVKSITLYNMLGQSIDTISNITQSDYSEYKVKKISAGTYIIKLQTASEIIVTKKIIVK